MVPRTGRPNRWLVEPVSTAGFTKRALVEMKEREKILIGKEKKTLADRKLQVSLDRADAIIEGASGSSFEPGTLGFSPARRYATHFIISFSAHSIRSLIFGVERSPIYRNNLTLHAYSRLRVFGTEFLDDPQAGMISRKVCP
jgi:hypothetical protein